MAFDLEPPTGPSPRTAFDASDGVVGAEAIAALERDGVVCLRNFLPADEIPDILSGCDEARLNPTDMATTIGESDGPSFFYDFNVSDRMRRSADCATRQRWPTWRNSS